MQTLLAFAFHDRVTPQRIQEGLSRVRRWYDPMWEEPMASHLTVSSRLGLQLWDRPGDDCRWPSWWHQHRRTVASLYAPLGWERLTTSADISTAPPQVSDRLQRRPADVMQLTAPFVLASLDEDHDRLTLQTDGLGLGRLFEVRGTEGRFWSNRPVAALLFAGIPAEADPVAWRRMAACDWPMGDSTPYRGVRTIAAATSIHVTGSTHREETLDVLTALVESRRDPLGEDSLRRTAEALVETARSSQRLWPDKPVLSLSGGRDSRLVVAAYLAAGVDVTVRTYAAASGEAATARHLVDLLPGRVEHQVVTPTAQRAQTRRTGAYARAVRWHHTTEGLRPALYLRNSAPRTLLHNRPALICGVGGEFGHAPGYPDDVERLERLAVPRRIDAFARALQAKVVLPRGVSDRAVEEVNAQVRTVLRHAAARHVTDAKMLDWFYADERLRRFGMAGESFGRVMPLLAPEFLSAAFGLSTSQSRASSLHSALIARLVPAWAGIDYYSATLKQRQAVPQQRLWQERDVELLSDVIADPDGCGDGFDVPVVASMWRQARLGRAAGRDELLLQRVIWRAAFTDHLAAVNGSSPIRRRSAGAAPASRPVIDLNRLVRLTATRANDVPLARRLARTSVGRSLRRRLGV